MTYPASPRTETPGIVLHSFSKGTLNILQLSNRLNPPGTSDEPVAMIISSNTVSIQHFDFKELLQTVSCSRELLQLDQQALCKRAAGAHSNGGRGFSQVCPPCSHLLTMTLRVERQHRRPRQACGLTENWGTKARVSTSDLGELKQVTLALALDEQRKSSKRLI